MGKKRISKKEYTEDMDEAWRIFNTPVLCGECYNWYNPKNKDKCPCCGSTEWVGSR